MLSSIMKNIVNDLDVDALEAFVADVAANPEHGQMRFGVTTRWTGRCERKPGRADRAGRRNDRSRLHHRGG